LIDSLLIDSLQDAHFDFDRDDIRGDARQMRARKADASGCWLKRLSCPVKQEFQDMRMNPQGRLNVPSGL
jgi:hypothetical protein